MMSKLRYNRRRLIPVSIRYRLHRLSSGVSRKQIYARAFACALFLVPLIALCVYVISPQPAIRLVVPVASQVMTDRDIYVRGVVKPPGALVRVNGKVAQGDGDGNFTVFVSAPAGRSVLRVEASYIGKHAQFLEPITRELSQEERLAIAERKQKEEAAIKQRVLGEDRSIDALLSSSQDGDFVHVVQVTSHTEEHDGRYVRVLGEVINSTLAPVYWVKVTAKFFDASDQVVDTKLGFAVAKDESLPQGATRRFTTQATSIPHLYYKLTVDWKNTEHDSTNSAEFNGNNVDTSATSSAIPTATFPAQSVLH